MNINQLPTFLTDRLILRGVTQADIPAYEKYFVDYEIIQHLAAHVPWPYPKNGVEWFLNHAIFPTQGQSTWMWGIFEKENPLELIGAVHLWLNGTPEHRGFWLGKNFWGKGYMTEAVIPVMDYAFDHLGFEKLIFANAMGNARSGRVKEKTGAKLIDVRPARFVNPKYTEHEIWELKKENWNADKNYFFVSADKKLINIETVHSLLTTSYWSQGIPKSVLVNAIDNSLCFGVFKNNVQLAFARVVTDSATFAWLCDVIVEKKYRGQGLSKELMNQILSHPNLKGLRRICLATKDAHELYKQFGFKVTESPQNWMEIKNNEIYMKTKSE